MLGIFDSHAHYEDERFDEDRESLLSSMSSLGVEYIVNVGSSVKTSMQTVRMTEKYPYLYGSVGVHPEECADMTQKDIDMIRGLADNKKIVAIGEIGLDYHYPEPERSVQKKWFAEQMKLAVNLKMPVIVHSRDAAADTMEIIKQYGEKPADDGCMGGRHGVIHCYSGSAEMAKEYVGLGYYIGVGGVLTFKNASKLRKVVEEIDIRRLLIETDCPYMAPVPYRGKRNDSSLLKYVVQSISEIKNMAADEVIRITRDNALTMYGIEV
ncbi:MAG: TatD family hydrolase [Lachnospiraceae bacterium]|nr:TatD family hydrolase [Lachnospiraceae bacterium]